MAAVEYLRETGRADLDAHWIAEYFQDAGVLEEHPRQDLVAFADMVQKALDKEVGRIRNATTFLPDNVISLRKLRRKP
ncbi:MAG: hypothetical protein H7X91_04725 [Burkholderiales bacterium]|nr:hypothetical protein [Burkholderiales bacterium]